MWESAMWLLSSAVAGMAAMQGVVIGAGMTALALAVCRARRTRR